MQNVKFATRRHPRQEFTMEGSPVTPVEHSSEGTHRGMVFQSAKVQGTAILCSKKGNNVLLAGLISA